MKRRTLLAGVAASPSLTGCLRQGGKLSSPTDTGTRTADTPSPTPTPARCTSADPRAVTLVGTADLPTSLDLSMSATVQRSRPTAETPARLDVMLANGGDRRGVSPSTGRCNPFNRDLGESDPAGLWLSHLDDPTYPEERVEGCWTKRMAPDETPQPFPQYGCSLDAIEPGETITTTHEVWDDHRVEGYYPTGRYRFATTVVVGPVDGDRSDGESYDWWLDMEVSRPDS